MLLFFFFISALDSKAPKAEDIEEEDDDVPGMDIKVRHKHSIMQTVLFQCNKPQRVVVLQIWWRTSTRRQRTRRTEAPVHTDWTAVKQGTLSGVFKSSHPDISRHYPHKPETFLFYDGPRMSESDWLVHLNMYTKKQNNNTPLLVNDG